MSLRPVRRTALAVMAALAGLASAARADEVTVFAAASLKTAMDEIAAAYETATGDTVIPSFAGSSALARQIQFGAPADVFISANAGWMDQIEADGLLAEGSRFDLVNNAIVLIAHGADAATVEIGPALDLSGMLGEGRLAMALVDSVPAGIYGKAALNTLGLWEAVAPRVAQADNVRAALALVATGEAPLGIVYATDAVAEDKVSVVGTFPRDSHPPIVYPAAALRDGDTAAAARFLSFLHGDMARAALERQGFVVIGE